MPPPAAPAAAPVPADEPDEDAGPKLSPEEMLARMLGMKSSKAEDPYMEGLLERSAGISYDPKMKELSSMLSTEPAPAVPSKSRCALRTGGRDLVERRVKDLERGHLSQRPQTVDTGPDGRGRFSSGLTSPASVPQLRRVESSPTVSPLSSPTAGDKQQSPDKAMRQRFDTTYHRAQFRDHTDKTLKRLLVDMDLARPDHQKQYSHQSRCDHLDKMHGWYLKHSYKEKNEVQQKDKKPATQAPPYLVFSQEGPVSPGSLRVQFKHQSPLLRKRSDSSPALDGI